MKAKEMVGKERAWKVFEKMLLSRYVDDKMGKLVRQNKGGTFQIRAAGHEMIAVAAAQALIPGKDWGFPYYRDQPFVVGLGCDLVDLFAAFLARDTPYHCGGRQMPHHFSHAPMRLPCQSSCVATQYLPAAGKALSIKMAGLQEVVYVSGGDGSTSEGDFFEALNFSCLHRLGVIFMIQDNGWAISVPTKDQTAGGSIAALCAGFEGLAIYDIDGTDFEAVAGALDEAVLRARSGHGPCLIRARVPRLAAHSSSDDPGKYKPQELLEEENKKDPLARMEQWLFDHKMATHEEVEDLKRRLRQQVEAASNAAEEIPFPKKEHAEDYLFVETTLKEAHAPKSLGDEKIVIMDALNHALDEEMARDPSIVVFGEDVAKGKGGVFGITRGLTAKHGEERCFNSPLAESTIVGVALGLSLNGAHRAVAEVQFADYLWPGIDQLFSEVSSYHYRSRGQWSCPLVVRIPYGGYIQGGPYHSQSIEGYLAHCPGLKIVIPSNAHDAKGLLKAAIRDPNPVVFLEHKALYRQQKFCARQEPDEDFLLPLGKAAVVRQGRDLTVLAWGMMVVMASEVADRLEKEGISVELIDLRTLSPLDMTTLLSSVKKTGKVLIAHEAPKTCGFGAELAARIMEEAFEFLDAPVARLGAKDVPVPYCKDLENAVLPQPADIEASIRRLAAY